MVQPNVEDIVFWAHTLVDDFPDDDIPELFSREDWREWGNDLILCINFAENGAPSTYNYESWQEWAWDLYYTMNNFA